METIHFHLKGRVATMMQAAHLADPLHPMKQQLKLVTDKRKKTDADHEEIARIEYLASLYCDKDAGPYWPGENIERMFYDAAKLSRRGQDVKRGLMVLDNRAPLLYEGPRTPEALYADKNFVDRRCVVLAGKRTMRCRPIFREWQIEFDVSFDSEIFNRDTLMEVAKSAGQYVGLSMFRPRYGRFDIIEGI